ncbi:hypothetical protein [Streptomyces europaeiscabiei]|uniref:hypothetical protein n=1 Tax=Streptomyces europaeiscabiei TaxID=146819 RepID=UPI00399B81D3
MVQKTRCPRQTQPSDDERYHDEPRGFPGLSRVAEIRDTGGREEEAGYELPRAELMT